MLIFNGQLRLRLILISILLVKRPEKVFNINCLVPEALWAPRRKSLILLAFSAHFFLDNAIKNPAVAG